MITAPMVLGLIVVVAIVLSWAGLFVAFKEKPQG